jgi:hypothetical protein
VQRNRRSKPSGHLVESACMGRLKARNVVKDVTD